MNEDFLKTSEFLVLVLVPIIRKGYNCTLLQTKKDKKKKKKNSNTAFENPVYNQSVSSNNKSTPCVPKNSSI